MMFCFPVLISVLAESHPNRVYLLIEFRVKRKKRMCLVVQMATINIWYCVIDVPAVVAGDKNKRRKKKIENGLTPRFGRKLNTRNTCEFNDAPILMKFAATPICTEHNFIYLFCFIFHFAMWGPSIKTYIVIVYATLLLLKQKIWRLVLAVSVLVDERPTTTTTIQRDDDDDDYRWCLTFFERSPFRKLAKTIYFWFDWHSKVWKRVTTLLSMQFNLL